MSPGPTFLRTFYDYLCTRSDCPPDFFTHAGMVALATALGNRVWSDGWSRNIYPNLWVVVIAPSGYGKSVPLDYASDLLKMAGFHDNILPDSFSGEALYQVLAKEAVGVFFLQEFAAFMGALGRDYNAGAMNWLTAIYDVPDTEKRTLANREYILQKPTVSILGASSPAWFSETYKGSHLGGGFLARFIFCPAKVAGTAIDFPGPRDRGREVALADHLRQVAELRGRADFDGVERTFNHWQTAARRHLRNNCPEEFSGIRSRAGLMVRKAAMLFHVSRDPTNLRITEDDLSNAIKYVERAHKQAEDYLTNSVAQNQEDGKRMKVVEILARMGGRASRSDVLRAAHLSSDELGRAVKTLVESNRVIEERTGRITALVLTEALILPRENSQTAGEFSVNSVNGVKTANR